MIVWEKPGDVKPSNNEHRGFFLIGLKAKTLI